MSNNNKNLSLWIWSISATLAAAIAAGAYFLERKAPHLSAVGGGQTEPVKR